MFVKQNKIITIILNVNQQYNFATKGPKFAMKNNGISPYIPLTIQILLTLQIPQF